MKNKSLIWAVALIVVLALSVWGYKTLSAGYSSDGSSPTAGGVEGQTADFTVENLKSEKVTLSELFGKPIVINFWATWCGPCKSELPAFEDAYAEYGEEVEFLMVNLTDGVRDSTEKVEKFISQNGYTFPVYLDKELDGADSYGVYSIPMTVFIGEDGVLVSTHTGSMSYEKLTRYIKSILPEE